MLKHLSTECFSYVETTKTVHDDGHERPKLKHLR